ncbi:MAG TPA: hypothetical protein ENK28_07105 [Aliiroseovarius sp.]|nr:hypothetical protein [Aliiroseovarius sp.]
MIKTFTAAAVAALFSTAAFAGTYTVTVTNNMATELLAPILITDVENDNLIFSGNYVTKAAEEQILTGDPAALAKRIGSRAMAGHRASVAHGTDGPPGVLLAPGKSLSFIINTEASSVRILSMVAPTEVPDNYVTAVVDLKTGEMMSDDSMSSDSMSDDAMMANGMVGDIVALDRYDIGNDEGTKTITPVKANVATITFVEKM